MILFKDYHVYPLSIGLKTYTRRFWKYPKKVDSIHRCQLNFNSKSCFGELTITDVYRKSLGSMIENDAYLEGGYTLSGYKKTLESITKKPWDPFAVPYVVKFRFVLSDVIDSNGGSEEMDEYKRLYLRHMQEIGNAVSETML